MTQLSPYHLQLRQDLSDYESMRTALLSVAHLLPSGESGNMDTRKQFEAYFNKYVLAGNYTNINDKGDYTNEDCYRHWKTWQAALAAHPAASVGVPDGWKFRWHAEGDDSLLLISHPKHGGVGVHKEPTGARTIPEEILYLLARDYLAAAPSAPQGVE